MTQPIQVLHVDDDPESLELAAVALQQADEGFEVETARSASEGLDRLAGEEDADAVTVDCVVSEYDMHGTDGIEFLEAVRDRWPDLPFVLFTAEGSEGVASEAIARGVTDYLQKESSSERYELLANRIRRAVERHDASRRAESLDRIRGTVRSINRALIGAETREEVDSQVCELLVDTEPYIVAWIDEHDPEAGTVQSRAAAGIDAELLESLTIVADRPRGRQGSAGQGSTRQAETDHEVAVVQNVPEEVSSDSERGTLVDRGGRSWAAVPLVHEEHRYGILNVCADRTHVFGRREREFLREVGENVAHAHHRLDLQRQYEAQYRELFEEAPVMIASTRDTENGPVIEVCNRRFADRLGYDDPTELLGNSWRMLYGPDEIERFETEIFPELDEHGQWRGEATGLRADGTTFPQEVSLSRLDDGGLVCVVRDVSEFQEKLDAVRDLQGRTQELIRERDPEAVASRAVDVARETLGLPLTGIHLVDEDREVLEPVAVTDDVVEHLGFVPQYSRINPDRSVDEFNWEIFEAGEPVVFEDLSENSLVDENETPTRSGIVHPLNEHGVMITSAPEPRAFDDFERQLTEVLATILTAAIDRTEREAALEEQKRQLKAKTERLDQFASVVSHDLRNPLNVARGRIDLALEDCDCEHLPAVDRSLDRMDRLIEDLLRLARHGETATETGPVSLAQVAEACWSTVDTGSATLAIESDVTLVADRSRLRQLLENLVHNAVEHGNESVTVTIGVLEDGFFVEDDGPGIDEADRDAVFEAGYSTSPEGTGFGLSIVRGIVEAHDWEISLATGRDGGARFEITGVDVDGAGGVEETS